MAFVREIGSMELKRFIRKSIAINQIEKMTSLKTGICIFVKLYFSILKGLGFTFQARIGIWLKLLVKNRISGYYSQYFGSLVRMI